MSNPSRMALFLLAFLACQSGGPAGSAPPATPPAKNAAPPAAPPKRLPSPEYLPPEARVMLSDRMQRHGFDMTNLLWAMLFLEYGAVAEISGEVAAGPWIAEPIPEQEDLLNTMLPARFFDLQGELIAKSRQLAAVAREPQPDPKRLAAAFGELSATCVQCHATFLYGEEKPAGP